MLVAKSTTKAGKLTLESCVEFCAGSTFFGVEYGQECYCGASLNSKATASTGCDHACDNNPSVRYGGGWNLDVSLSLALALSDARINNANKMVLALDLFQDSSSHNNVERSRCSDCDRGSNLRVYVPRLLHRCRHAHAPGCQHNPRTSWSPIPWSVYVNVASR